MKKFLLLSFLMVAFASALSYGQTRTISRSGGVPYRIQFNIIDRDPLSYDEKRYAVNMGVSTQGTEPQVVKTWIYVYIENYGGGDQYYQNTHNSDATWVDFTFIPENATMIRYSFEAEFEDGTFETCDVTDTYYHP